MDKDRSARGLSEFEDYFGAGLSAGHRRDNNANRPHRKGVVMNGMTSDPRDHEAFVREIDLGAYESAVSSLPRGVIPRRKGMTWGNILARLKIGEKAGPGYTLHSTTCYLFRHPADAEHASLPERVPVLRPASKAILLDGTRWYYGMFPRNQECGQPWCRV